MHGQRLRARHDPGRTMRRSRLLCAFVAVLALGIGTAGVTDDAAAALPGGDALLARAADDAGVQSYSVPVKMDVHLHRMFGLSVRVEGQAYYKAPGKSALVITKAPAVIGRFFKGSYNLDLLPQAWPAKYRVTSTSATVTAGTPAYALDAVPRTPNGVDHVVFTVARAGFAPLSAEWFYADHSTIGLSIGIERVGNTMLPRSESVAVAMPKYKLDATSSFGRYELNVPVADSIFTTQ